MSDRTLAADPLGYVIRRLNWRHMLDWAPDALYLRLVFRAVKGKWPRLRQPRTFCEKLQWLKLHDRDPFYSQLADKYEVRRHVAGQLGGEYLIPLVGGPWDSAADIDFDALPEQFVLKCTHDSGSLVICRDKAALDREATRARLERSLKRNYFLSGREWPYKGIRGRIIAEKYMEEPGSPALTDYKVFCFNGVPRTVLTVTGGHEDEAQICRRMYDTDWNLLPVGLNGKPPVQQPQPRPEQLEEILALAEKLGAGKRHVRVDFYVIDGRVYFGEVTFFHMSGLVLLDPPEWDDTFGSWIDLEDTESRRCVLRKQTGGAADGQGREA